MASKRVVKRGPRPKPEYSLRPFDRAKVKWEWRYETELGIYPRDWAVRFPHLADRGRWVITEIQHEKDQSRNI